MSRLRALVLCPGRGSYSRKELGSLQGRASAALDAFDALRAEKGLPGPRALDAEARFSPRKHIAGEHASILTAGATLADVEAIDASRFELVGVMGNSMGWYTALGAAGSLSLEACGRLVETMGSYQAGNLQGGQVVYPMVDAQWRRDPVLVSAVHEAVEQIPDLHWSIFLGGQAVLGGTEEALARAAEVLPAQEGGAGLRFPLRLPLHSAFHTPLLSQTRARAEAELEDLAFSAPKVPLIDGQGRLWRPRVADPKALQAYTLGPQVDEAFDFTTMVRSALGQLAPDVIILPGPGSNLGGALAHVLVETGWSGIASKEDFVARQRGETPLLLSMGWPDQRVRVVGS